MRIRVGFLGVMAVAFGTAALCAETLPEQSQPAQQLEKLNQLKMQMKAPLTSTAERAALHNGPDWDVIAPHLPDPATASAAELETAADVLRARRFPEDALDYYGYAMAHGGDVSELLNKMGVVRLELGQIDLAREMFQRTVRAQKKNAKAWNNLGVAEYLKGNYFAATKDYKKATGLDREAASFHSNLGMAYFEMKDMKNAQRQFAIAVQLDPTIMDPARSGGTMIRVVGTANYGSLCFQMASMYAHWDQMEAMEHWLAKACEAGYDVKSGMMQDAVLKPYLQSPAVKVMLANAELMHKTLARITPPPLGSAPGR